jgi:hypothetical protein
MAAIILGEIPVYVKTKISQVSKKKDKNKKQNLKKSATIFLDPPISTDHCDWLYGIFGHETSCTRYWTCWNGTATEQFCVGGLLYNEETHACDWPQNVAGCQKHRKLNNTRRAKKQIFKLRFLCS